MRRARLLRFFGVATGLAAVACVGAWTATALGQVGPPPLPTVSVTVTVPPVTLPPLPPVTVPPVTVPSPPPPPVAAPPVTLPSVTAPGAPAAPALPAVGATPGSSPAVPGAGGAGSWSDSTAPSASGTESTGPDGASSAGGGSPAAEDGPAAEEERLLRRRSAAARGVRATRNVRPVPARFSNRGKARRSTILVFWLARPGRVVFTVLGEAPSCRALGSFAARGRSGVNRVRYRGRLHGRPLPPGRYTLVPRVYRPGSVTRLEQVTIEILPANAKTPLWRRTALVPTECSGGGLPGVWEPSTASGGTRFVASVGTAPAPARSPTGGVKGAAKTVPPPAVEDEPDEGDIAVQVPFYADGEGGRPSLAAVVMLAAFGLGFMTAVVLVARARETPIGLLSGLVTRAVAPVARGTVAGVEMGRWFLRGRGFTVLDAATYALALLAAAVIGVLIALVAGS